MLPRFLAGPRHLPNCSEGNGYEAVGPTLLNFTHSYHLKRHIFDISVSSPVRCECGVEPFSSILSFAHAEFIEALRSRQ